MPNTGIPRLVKPKNAQEWEIEEPYTWFDDSIFHEYRDRIWALIVKSEDRGVCTGDIHRKLGKELQHMTQDALDTLDTEAFGVQPVRYRVQTRYLTHQQDWRMNNAALYMDNGTQ